MDVLVVGAGACGLGDCAAPRVRRRPGPARRARPLPTRQAVWRRRHRAGAQARAVFDRPRRRGRGAHVRASPRVQAVVRPVGRPAHSGSPSGRRKGLSRPRDVRRQMPRRCRRPRAGRRARLRHRRGGRGRLEIGLDSHLRASWVAKRALDRHPAWCFWVARVPWLFEVVAALVRGDLRHPNEAVPIAGPLSRVIARLAR